MLTKQQEKHIKDKCLKNIKIIIDCHGNNVKDPHF